MTFWMIGSKRKVAANERSLVFDSNTPWTEDEIKEIRSCTTIQNVTSLSVHKIKIEPASRWLRQEAFNDVKRVATKGATLLQ